jgi:hypothetical protein
MCCAGSPAHINWPLGRRRSILQQQQQQQLEFIIHNNNLARINLNAGTLAPTSCRFCGGSGNSAYKDIKYSPPRDTFWSWSCWSCWPPNYCGFGSVFPLFLKEICEQGHYTYWNGPPPVYSSFYCHIRMPECIAVTQRKKVSASKT